MVEMEDGPPGPLCSVDLEEKYEHQLEPFQPQLADEFAEDPERFEEEYDQNLRHYSQKATDLELDTLRELFSRLSFDPKGKTATIFGGYTGDFAERLSQLDCNIIFTDPMDEYVKEMKKKGFEAYTYYAENIPAEMVGRTDFFASFECYYPFGSGMLSIYCLFPTAWFLQSPN